MAEVGETGTIANLSTSFFKTMTHRSSNSSQRVNKKAIAWALFSQSIWLPVLIIDTQDQIASKSSDYDFSGVAANIPNQNLPEPIALASAVHPRNSRSVVKSPHKFSETNGVVLNAISPEARFIESKLESIPTHTASAASPIAFSASIRPPSISLPFQFRSTKAESQQSTSKIGPKYHQPSELLLGIYSRSDLLGGTVTLGDLNEPLMPPIARAERAQSARSGDPLSTVPQMLREPMRKALKKLSHNISPVSSPVPNKVIAPIKVDQARVIHIPSTKVKHFSEIPLALQADGTVDILNTPDDPEVVEEIKTWSTKQQLPEKGRMAPAVVHLHPLPQQVESPTSEKITSPSAISPQKVEVIQEASPASAPEVKEASVPDLVPQDHPQISPPSPPPPITETQTSKLPPLPPIEAETTIAEAHTRLASPASQGAAQ